jgi:acyl-CoA synthetase (AMP-forming)/AMP-acid ligase II
MHRLERQYGKVPDYADWDKVADVELRVPALLAHFATYGDAELLVFDDQRLLYREAERQSALLARQLLAAGMGKGSRVGMWFASDARFIVVWLAIVRIGAVAVPISTLATGPELRKIAAHADLHMLLSTDRYLHHDYVERLEAAFPGLKGARAPFTFTEAPYLRRIWIWGGRCPAWAEAIDLSNQPGVDAALLAAVEAEVAPADAVSIIYTSGSTADPKGVIHAHAAFMRQGAKVAATFPYQSGDRIFTQMPYFWVGGLTLTLLSAMHLGATLLGSGKVGAPLLDFLEQERVSFALGWPHLMKALAADPSLPGRNFSAMRGGSFVEAVPEKLRPKNQYFGWALGMTETCGPHTASPFDLPQSLTGSFGTPMPGMQLKIVDVDTRADAAPGQTGELYVRGDALTMGMVKRERADVFEPDGWYRTGDLCSFREGHLFFHGRTDDLIKTAGANVSPKEVEAALMGLPGVAQAYVSSVADKARGAVVGAIIVPAPQAVLHAESIRKDAAKSLASYKVPKVVVLLEAAKLPTMSSSKVDRRALIRLLHDAHAEG